MSPPAVIKPLKADVDCKITGAEVDVVATPKVPRTMAPKKVAILKAPKGAKLAAVGKIGLPAICAMTLDGETLTSIAQRAGVSQGTLLNWIAADPVRSARVREARALTAQLWDQRALALLEGLDPSEGPIALGKARELAQHLRWRASKINPREYGDKVEQTIQGGTTPIKIQPVTPEAALAEIRDVLGE